jgi:flagellar biosynthesis/type III secretory pathway protein FliH
MREFFKNKQKIAFERGYLKGWNEGFDSGSTKTLAEARKVFVKRIQKEIKSVSNPMMVDKEYLDGLERAIELIGMDK